MTTPLSKMVALLIPSPLTPKRGRGSAGRLSEAKKVWRGRVVHKCSYGYLENVSNDAFLHLWNREG